MARGIFEIFYYLSENHKMVLNTYNSIGREHLETHLYSAVYNLVLNVVDEIACRYEMFRKKERNL